MLKPVLDITVGGTMLCTVPQSCPPENKHFAPTLRVYSCISLARKLPFLYSHGESWCRLGIAPWCGGEVRPGRGTSGQWSPGSDPRHITQQYHCAILRLRTEHYMKSFVRYGWQIFIARLALLHHASLSYTKHAQTINIDNNNVNN